MTRQEAHAIPTTAVSTVSKDVGKSRTRRQDSREIAGLDRPTVCFIWSFLGVGMMLCAWSFATPIAAAPDESSHIAQAAAVVRGQFDEPEQQTFLGPIAIVRVPSWVAQLPPSICFSTNSGIIPRCSGELSHATTTVRTATQFGKSPPLYYAVVGIPTLFESGRAAVYSMRVIGDLLNAALVALGISLLLRYHPRRTPLVGVLIALSPMVLFLMAVVNSSGLEIASGFATWCGGVCIVEHPEIPRPLAIWTAVAVVLLVLSRPASPLDALIIAVTLAFLIGWRGLRERLNPSLRPLWIPVAMGVVIATAFLVIVGPVRIAGIAPAHPASLLSNMWKTLRLTGLRLRQCIGNFGYFDTPVPTWVIIVWTTCLGALTAVALFLSAPCRRALPVLALAILAMPLALESPLINQVNLYWQGRYWLPVMVGFPLVASTLEWRHGDREQPSRWAAPSLTLVLGIVLIIAQVASFEHALTRYEIGLVVSARTPVAWLPPGGNVGVVVVFVVGAIVTLALAVVMTSKNPEDWNIDRATRIIQSREEIL